MTSWERANSDLANAGRRKDEAERNEAVAYKEMQQVHKEEHRLSLEESKIMEQVNVSTACTMQSAHNNVEGNITVATITKDHDRSL